MLKKSDKIIASVKKLQTRYLKMNHRFGIELTNVKQTLALDAKNGNTLWVGAISK